MRKTITIKFNLTLEMVIKAVAYHYYQNSFEKTLGRQDVLNIIKRDLCLFGTSGWTGNNTVDACLGVGEYLNLYNKCYAKATDVVKHLGFK